MKKTKPDPPKPTPEDLALIERGRKLEQIKDLLRQHGVSHSQAIQLTAAIDGIIWGS